MMMSALGKWPELHYCWILKDGRCYKHVVRKTASWVLKERPMESWMDGHRDSVLSDWPDLNNLCWRTGTELKWTSHYQPVEVSDAVIEDPSVIMEARLHHNNIVHLLQPRTSILSCQFKEPKIWSTDPV